VYLAQLGREERVQPARHGRVARIHRGDVTAAALDDRQPWRRRWAVDLEPDRRAAGTPGPALALPRVLVELQGQPRAGAQFENAHPGLGQHRQTGQQERRPAREVLLYRPVQRRAHLVRVIEDGLPGHLPQHIASGRRSFRIGDVHQRLKLRRLSGQHQIVHAGEQPHTGQRPVQPALPQQRVQRSVILRSSRQLFKQGRTARGGEGHAPRPVAQLAGSCPGPLSPLASSLRSGS
jgi:hypothetical protein